MGKCRTERSMGRKEEEEVVPRFWEEGEEVEDNYFYQYVRSERRRF